jgi:DNA-binding LacI/PurR family transcriptional regulator
MEDVAREAGVSRGLVSLVYRDAAAVSPARRAAVLAAAERLEYSPNQIASQLASARTNTLGLLLSDLHNPIFADVVDGILEVVDETPLQLVLATGGRSQEREERALARFVSLRADAVVAISTTVAEEQLARYGRGTQLLLVARQVATIDSVDTDNDVGGRLVTEHLLSLGHRRIAHISVPERFGPQQRRHAYEEVMAAAGLPATVVHAASIDEPGGSGAMRALLASGSAPTAVFGHNDVLAIGAMNGALEAGLDVPADVSIAGYDNSATAAHRRIDMTSIDPRARELGALAARLVLERLGDPASPVAQRTLPPRLVVRGSTAPASA